MLVGESSPTDAVRLSAQLLACARLGIVVDIPIKAVSALVAHLVKECAGEEDAGVTALKDYHVQVREYLLCLQRGAEAAASEKLGELELGLVELRESVLGHDSGRVENEQVVTSTNSEGDENLKQPSSSEADNEEDQGDRVKKTRKAKKRAD